MSDDAITFDDAPVAKKPTRADKLAQVKRDAASIPQHAPDPNYQGLANGVNGEYVQDAPGGRLPAVITADAAPITFDDAPHAQPAPSYQAKRQSMNTGPGPVETIGHGANKWYDNAIHLYLSLTDPAAADRYAQQSEENNQIYQAGRGKNANRFDPLSLLGEVAPTLAIPFGSAARAVGYSLKAGDTAAAVAGKSVLDSALTGGVLGATEIPSEGSSRIVNAGLGAVGGGLGSVAGQAAVKYAVNPAVAALSRRAPVATGRAEPSLVSATDDVLVGRAEPSLYPAPASAPVPAAVGNLDTPIYADGKSAVAEAISPKQNLIDAAKRQGVSLRRGDIPGNENKRGLEDALESVPGSGAFKRIKSQADEVKAMLVRGEETFKPAKMASGEYDDPNKLMADSLTAKYNTNKTEASALYGKMDAASNGNNFNTETFKATAYRLLKEQQKLAPGRQDAEVIKEAENALKWPSMDFATAHSNRSILGEDINQVDQKVLIGRASPRQLAAMVQLKVALENDMHKAASQGSPQLLNAWRDADGYYRQNVAPYYEKSVYSIIRGEADTDTIAQQFFKKDRGGKAGDFISLMNDDGKQAAKYVLFKRAQDAALNPNLDSGISNKAFLSKIDLGKTIPSVFGHDASAMELDDIVTVLRGTKRAGDFMANPKTGNRVAKLMVGGLPVAAGLGAGVIPAAGLALGGMGVARGLNAYTWSELVQQGLAQAALQSTKQGVANFGTQALRRLPGSIGEAALTQ